MKTSVYVQRKRITQYIASFASILCILIFNSSAYAQDEQLGTNESNKLWGLGTSITYPMARIYMIQASYSSWQYGDVLCGVAYQNWENDQGRSHAYTLLLGYRQFVWRGLHAEVELLPAYNPFHSLVDGKTYTGLELWMSLRIGYRFDFELVDKDFFILVQPGMGFGVARQNRWPDMENNNKPIFEPQLITGIRF